MAAPLYCLCLLLTVFQGGHSQSSQSSILEASALLEFKRGVKAFSPPWILDVLPDPLANWDVSSTSLCNWTGIACNPQGRVVSLALSNIPLTGQISSSLGSLEFLELLNLSYNYLSGEIPSTLGNCARLQSLDLTLNNLNGKIPESLGQLSMLQSLILDANLLGGEIPSSLARCSRLQKLSCCCNRLSGQLPSFLGQLRNLTLLDLSHNSLNGSIPRGFANLSSLEELNLEGNDLEGEIPTFLLVSKTLVGLHLHANNLESFSSEFQEISPENNQGRMEVLELGYNQITGSIPSQFFSYLPGLKFISLRNNNLTGGIPEFGDHCVLETINLSTNTLTGEIPESVLHCSQVTKLDLSRNRLTGVIPSELGRNLSTLTNFDVAFNTLHGEIPLLPEISKLEQLSYFLISTNKLVGTIPVEYFNMANLGTLDLARNNLWGSLPRACNLAGISKLDLSFNSLTGSIPSCLGNSSSLWTLDLSGNQISGEIPSSLGANASQLYYLDLSQNRLVGSLPASLGNCSSLSILMVARNQLGKIDMDFSQIHSLVHLDLSHNEFEGDLVLSSNTSNIRIANFRDNRFSMTIPESICRWTALTLLSFSYNQIHGFIPSCIWSSLPQLKVVDLSQNRLTGNIPGSIGELISFKDVNSRPDDPEGWHNIPGLACPECPGGMRFEMIIKGSRLPFAQYFNGLTLFDLSSNLLEGAIPDDIGLLVGMKYLNLSFNGLTGSIPLALTRLVKLESLDLSSNKLQGTIPAQISDLSQLGSFNVSHNHLSGMVLASELFYTKFGPSSFEGNNLCGGFYPLQPCSNTSTSTQAGRETSWLSENVSTKGFLLGALLGFFGTIHLVVFVDWKQRLQQINWIINHISKPRR
ncbi:probable leucine-rich repeat receptor-like protein kinase At1g35710 [Selaginella moellendorffii]|uniref:probable leucine-rich repeat receptor-like protein kinase At1g35710 n=1 Tax=Selaginella moellendorffii TaxID=88036 RepID=UPI000D1CAEC0|nr:probable leucine-rich repeat receptor-like protein kinase At1g35710 [Selaginella moellendorffii]|eukprot:XP_024534797.1 probable leucine-rich repeat receptor-like protein kinase At1g35710 [Selaginella moellendorffii]